MLVDTWRGVTVKVPPLVYGDLKAISKQYGYSLTSLYIAFFMSLINGDITLKHDADKRYYISLINGGDIMKDNIPDLFDREGNLINTTKNSSGLLLD